jgi:hypothetical protein
MAQDPENDEAPQDESSIDPSHDLDMVPLFSSQGVDAEMEADMIHGMLESHGVPSVLVRAAEFPPLGFALQVPRARLEEAERLIAEAEAAGPEAAAEAEANSEEAH